MADGRPGQACPGELLQRAQVESLVRGIESGMKQLEYIYRVDVVPIGGAQAVDT
jgi:hypothetical protein